MGFFEFEGLDGEAVGSVSEVLESIGADLGRRGRVITPHEIVLGFLESTPMLSFEEHAQLLGGVIEDQRATLSAASDSRASSTSSRRWRTAPRSPEDLGSIEGILSGIASGVSKAASLAQQGAQVAQQFRSPPRSSGSTSTSGRTSSGSSGSSSRSSGAGNIGSIFSSIVSNIPQAASLVQQGVQTIQQFRSPPPARPPTAAPTPPTAAPTLPTAVPEPASFTPAPGADAPTAGVPSSGFAPAAPVTARVGHRAPAGFAPSASYAPQPAQVPPQPAYAAPPGYPPPFGAGAMGQAQAGLDALGAMWQALRQGQIPPLPGQLPVGAGAGPLAPPPMATMPGARPPADATALLAMLLGLPQLQSALQSAAVLGPAGSRTMELPIPTAGTPGGVRNLHVPLGAVMNTLAALASRSMEELNASTQESDPEIPDYLVDEDGRFLVDPASAAERAALLTHMVRLHQAAHRAGWSVEAGEGDEGQDEAEAWARDAGFERWE